MTIINEKTDKAIVVNKSNQTNQINWYALVDFLATEFSTFDKSKEQISVYYEDRVFDVLTALKIDFNVVDITNRIELIKSIYEG